MLKRYSLSILLVLTICLTASFGQQNVASGICLTTRTGNSNDSRGLLNFGKIQRYDITNNISNFVADIYTGTNARCANISPNGTKCAFIRQDGQICVINIDGSGSVSTLGSIGVSNGEGWIDWPIEQWIYFTNWSNNTVKRVNTSNGSVETVGSTGLDHNWTISISQDGSKACFSASHDGWTSWVMTLGSGSISNVRKVGACGGSIAPDGSLVTENVSNHNTLYIKNFSNLSKVKEWTTAKSNGSEYWNRHRWASNTRDWVTITQGGGYQMPNYHNQILYYVPDGGTTYIKVTNNSNGGFNEGDDFWIGTVSNDPRIGVSPGSLEFNTQEGSNPSSKQVIVTNSGGGTLPSLSVSANQSWCKPTITGSSNSYTITVAIDVDGVSGGIYDAIVTVSGSGVSQETFGVKLTVVSPPVLTSITLPNVSVEPDGQVQLNATALDQFGNAMDPQPSFTWEKVSGEGSVSSSGLYSAPGSEGAAEIKVSSASVSETATVTIQEAPPVDIKVNCGGTGVSGWEDSPAYLTSSPDHPSFTFDGPHDLSNVSNPAPQDVYKTTTLDATENVYEFTGLPAGSYTVRIHFVLGSGHTGTFNMDYSIEGAEVLSDFDVKTDAGGYNKAIVKEFNVNVDDGTLNVTGKNDGGITVFCAGIEVIGGKQLPEAIRITSPNGDESYSTGDVITVTWEGDPDQFGAAVLQLSTDGGLSWESISGDASFSAFEDGATTGSFDWTVPAEFNGEQLKSADCKIKIYEYMAHNLSDVSDASFSINAEAAADLASRSNIRKPIAINHQGLVFSAANNQKFSISITDLAGKSVYLNNGQGTIQIRWESLGITSGVFLATIKSGETRIAQKFSLVR